MRPFLLAATLSIIGPALVPAGAAAQAPEDRRAIESFRDSLTGIQDVAALRRLEQGMIEGARADRDNVLRHLRLGFLALRLGELDTDSHFDDAASEFQWAIDLKPAWPYPHYGMGLAEYHIGDSQLSVVAGLQSMLGKDALSRSADAFARAAEVDPAFVNGLVELANTALAQRINIKLDVALAALRRSASTEAGQNPEVLLARGRVEREAGDADSALQAFRRYVAVAPSRSTGLYEVGRTRMMAGDLAGQLAYHEAAASDDSETVSLIRADLTHLADDSTLAAFDRTRGTGRVTWLREFWGNRDGRDLRVPGTRLAEHFRRFFYARRNFALVSTKRHYDIVERFRSGSKDFDDRGIIYLRHGEPTARASYSAPDIEPNESWRYSRPDGDLLFHFWAREDVSDYKLVESLFDLLGFNNAVLLGALNGPALNSEASALLTSRERLSPLYGRLQNISAASGERFRADERRLGRESIRLGTTTDSYGLTFSSDLEATVDVLALGHDGEDGLVQITYAIRGERLRPVRMIRGVLYNVRVRFVALDSANNVVATLDTTGSFVAAAEVPPREHLLGRAVARVPPGTHAFRVAVEQGTDAGTVTELDSVRVTPPSTPVPTLSDIALGSGVSDLRWVKEASGDTVYFNPLRRYRRSDEMRVYYEVGGIAGGEEFETEIVVKRGTGRGGFLRRLFGGGGAALRLNFKDRINARRGVERAVSLEKLSPGDYTVEVTVTDALGRKDQRAASFAVVGR